MSTSANDSVRRIARKKCLVWLAVSAGCGAFGAVYEQFAHGVWSPFMVWLFAVPLIGGGIPAAVLFPLRRCYPAYAVRGVWDAGVASLTVGCCMRGVFDIYGTTVPLLAAYGYAGALLLGIAMILYIVQCIRHINQHQKWSFDQ